MHFLLWQVTADQPIKTHNSWDLSWWLWIVIGFIILTVIFSINAPRSRRGS
jgi:hypothetical protein